MSKFSFIRSAEEELGVMERMENPNKDKYYLVPCLVCKEDVAVKNHKGTDKVMCDDCQAVLLRLQREGK